MDQHMRNLSRLRAVLCNHIQHMREVQRKLLVHNRDQFPHSRTERMQMWHKKIRARHCKQEEEKETRARDCTEEEEGEEKEEEEEEREVGHA
jgi:hypothetical protein